MAGDGLSNQRWLATITLVVITLLNVCGVRVVALINNTGVLFELLGLLVFAVILALFHNNQGVDVVFETGGPDFSAANFLVAMFMGLFVIYGFDTASTLAKETNDPRRVAPRAVLGSVAAALIVGFVFLWAMLINFMWHRVATNPKPEETDGLLDFGVGFIDGLPIQWSVIGTVILLGAIHYAVRGSHIPAPPASERPGPTPV